MSIIRSNGVKVSKVSAKYLENILNTEECWTVKLSLLVLKYLHMYSSFIFYAVLPF